MFPYQGSGSFMSAAYAEASSQKWTRAGLLAALFENAVNRLELAQQQICGDLQADAQLNAQWAANQRHLLKLILVILEGVNPNHDAISRQVYSLCTFALGRISDRDYGACLRAIRPLYEAFQAIRPEADRMEMEGQIPRLDELSALNVEV